MAVVDMAAVDIAAGTVVAVAAAAVEAVVHTPGTDPAIHSSLYWDTVYAQEPPYTADSLPYSATTVHQPQALPAIHAKTVQTESHTASSHYSCS